MTPIDALILGVVEGVTEFLPVSSTGHLILSGQLLGLQTTEFLKSFEIAIQLGAILAVVALYWRSFLNMEVMKRVIAAFIPTAIIGLALYKVVKTYLLESELVVLWALLLGGVALIVFEYLHKESDDASAEIASMSYKQAIGVGFFQAIAIVPGVSRSAATIIGGLLLGMRRVAIVEFSFLLAVPTMVAATTLDIVKNYQAFTSTDMTALAIGFGTAFVVAIVVVKAFLRYVQTRTFVPFGVYRIVIALVFLLALIEHYEYDTIGSFANSVVNCEDPMLI